MVLRQQKAAEKIKQNVEAQKEKIEHERQKFGEVLEEKRYFIKSRAHYTITRATFIAGKRELHTV